MSDTYDTLTGIFRDIFDDDTIVVTPGLSAADVPEWDSLTHIRLILAIQKRFGVTFSAAQTASLQTVGDLVGLIKAKALTA